MPSSTKCPAFLFLEKAYLLVQRTSLDPCKCSFGRPEDLLGSAQQAVFHNAHRLAFSEAKNILRQSSFYCQLLVFFWLAQPVQ